MGRTTDFNARIAGHWRDRERNTHRKLYQNLDEQSVAYELAVYDVRNIKEADVLERMWMYRVGSKLNMDVKKLNMCKALFLEDQRLVEKRKFSTISNIPHHTLMEELRWRMKSKAACGVVARPDL